ncbi:MAG: efflux RND transporter periplasmic adaptor subunit [Leptospirales bacterium]
MNRPILFPGSVSGFVRQGLSLAIVALCLGLTACSRSDSAKTAKPAEKPVLPVKSVPVHRGSFPAMRNIPGRVTFNPVYYKRVMARVSAISTVRLLAFPGDFVRKGQVVAVLRSPDFMTAESELVSVLRNRGKRSSSSSSLLSLSESKLRYLGASSAEIRRLLKTLLPSDRYEVRTPIDGTIVKTGEMEGSQVHPGDVLFEVSDLHHLWVKAFIYPGEEGQVRKGSPVEILTLHPPVQKVVAKVEQVYPMVDPVTRTIPIRISLPNPDLSFEPDLWVSVLIPIHSPSANDLYMVPARSVFESQQGGTRVFVQDKGGTFRSVPVSVQAINGDQSTVSGDFRPGDRAVTGGLERVRALMKGVHS